MENANGQTLTFLFTMVEGSTRLWESHPQAMPAALTRHHAILQAAITEHGGHLFQLIGDEFCVAFDEPVAAVRCAVAAQQALQVEDWQAVGRLGVKMALNSGLAVPRGSDYYAPPTFNRLARTLAVAHGGQILLTAASHALLQGHLPPEFELRDLGERELRDLPPERVYQLNAPGLPDEFPPIPTLNSHPHNLPAQLTGFVGRESEITTIRTLLRQPHTRLLTLTGPGGVGKTRLSLQVASALLDEFTDGTYFVALAPVSDPALVVGTIAATLGVKEQPGQERLAALKEHLRDKRLLLVLDNFEQVVAAAPDISALVATCPSLKVLVSSREVLHLYGEQEYAVPPLPLPDLAHLPQLSELAHYSAIALFVSHARTAQPDFALTDGNAAAVAEICTRLDGLPLAIELAAARVRSMSVEQIRQRLDSRLALLQSTYRNRDPRQRSLREAILWSYDLLTEPEQRLFRLLGLFVGGADLEAIVAITGEDEATVLEQLMSLVDKSLLRVAD